MWLRWFKVTDRIVACYDKSSKFLPYQLSMVVYWTTMAVTGNGELGFDSGEGAWETATTTTVWQQGRKLANPNSGSQWQEIANRETQFLRYWNENSVNLLARNNWRASLVPAAAVIPAPIAYTKVVAVKKLVVEFLVSGLGQPLGVCTCGTKPSMRIFYLSLSWWVEGPRHLLWAK